MPLYEYNCEKCHKSFDHLARSMAAADARPACPGCGSEQTVRALSVFAVGAASGGRPAPRDDSPSCGRCGGAPGSCQS